MLKFKNIFKKLDIIIIVILVLLSFIPEVIFAMNYNKSFNYIYAEVTISGKVYKKIPLTGHKNEEEIEIDTGHGKNIVLVKDESIAMIEADCPDKVCLNTGFISKPGESIVCLPHKVMVQIRGDNEDDIILSY